MKPAVSSVVGMTSPTHWGQVLQLPAAYGVVEVEVADAIARQRGIDVLMQLTRYLTDPPTSLQGLEDIADDVMDGDIKTLLMLVPVGDVVYLVLRGEGAVYIKRENQLAKLMDAPGAISGKVQKGDTILLSSYGFVRAISGDELAQTFDHLSAPEVAEKLTICLHEKDGQEGGAALIFQVVDYVSDGGESIGRESEVVQSIAQKTFWHNKSFRTAMSNVLPLSVRNKLRLLRHVRLNTATIIALFVICFFLLSVGLGIRRKIGRTKNQAITSAVTQAQHAFDEGMALLDLNPVKGRERLKQAKDVLDPIVGSIVPRSAEGRQVAVIYRQITDALTQAMHVTQQEPQLYFDVSLLKKGAQASALSISGDKIGILDSSGQAVYSVDFSSKKGQVAGGDAGFGVASAVAAYGDKIYTLTDSGIHETRTSDNKTTQSVIPKDSQWGSITGMVAYGGNLYLLDTQKGRIWKYVSADKTPHGFSELREYLNPDTLPDFSQATGMAIDGTVWVGTRLGKLLRFIQGKESTFAPEGVEPALGTNLFVYTSDDVKNLYVLDSQNKRVVVLDKDGNYLAQYVWESNMNPDQIVVSEAKKLILLLAEGKIYSIDLQ